VITPRPLDLSALNPAQREAVTVPPGPVLVFAGAGSGKTRCLTHRIAWLLGQGVDPAGILAITFTNKAAREMRERLAGLLGVLPEDPNSPLASMRIGTFHAQFMRLLRTMPLDEFGITSRFRVYDEDDSERVVKQALSDAGAADLKPDAVVDAISTWKNLGLQPDDALARASDAREYRLANLYAAYQIKLAASDAVDFDDLLLLPMLALSRDNALRSKWASRFRHVLVDEFQDTNAVQLELLKQLSSVHRSLWVVGDDSQSIYSWRGAQVENILSFEESFPDARRIVLDQNYRSTTTILNAANQLITANSRGIAKKLWSSHGAGHGIVFKRLIDEDNEALFIVREMRRLHVQLGVSYEKMAILMRKNSQSRALEAKLSLGGVPYRVIGGVKFWTRVEVKDLVSWLRAIVSPRDGMAWSRALSKPKRGIGAASIEKLAEYAASHGNDWVAACSAAVSGELAVTMRAAAREQLSQFILLRNGWANEAGSVEPQQLIRRVLSSSHLLESYDDGSDTSQRRQDNLAEVVNAAGAYEPGQLERMLDEVALSSEADNEAKEAVSVMTMHAAKGLEFPVVFICGCEAGILPMINSDDVEEERRLFYVGITRAQRLLYLTAAAQRSTWGKTSPQAVSPFVRELPADLLTKLPADRA